MTFPSTGELLREVARLHVQLQRTCVASCGGTTTMQCTVLTELGRSGPVTLATLSRRIGFDKSWTSRAVETLVQEGFVEKVGSTEDRRTLRLSLSSAGEARLADLNHTLGALADQAFEYIPVEHHTTVRSSLELLQQALHTLTGEDLFAANLTSESRAQIGKAQPEDLPHILALLERCGLPLLGVAEVREATIVARKEGKVIGCAAFEVYGPVALLRSLAVDPAHRGQALGRALVQRIVKDAHHLEIHQIYLLTETASDYFPRFGFRLLDRSDVAPAIQRSVEWKVSCPSSAQAMVLYLDAV